MNETISIRRFRESDAEPVSRLIVDALLTCCGPDYPPEPLGAFARSQTPACMRERGRTTHFYVAEEDGTPVGCAAVGRDPEDPGVCGVYSFYVMPDKQGRGGPPIRASPKNTKKQKPASSARTLRALAGFFCLLFSS